MSLTTCFILLLIPLLGSIFQLFIVLIFGAPKYIVNSKSPSNVDSGSMLDGIMWFDLGSD